MPTTAAELKALYAEALKLQKAGKGPEALKLYKRINEVNPKIPEVHFQVARLFLDADKPMNALGSAKAAASLRPKEPEVWKLWAEAVRTLSDGEEQRIFKDAVSQAPIDKRLKGTLSTATALTGKSHTPLGDLPENTLTQIHDLALKGEYAQAERAADLALKRHPNAAPLHRARAVVLLEQNRTAEAIAAVKEAVRLEPDFAKAWADYADILRKTGRPRDGITMANRALKLSPGLPQALINRARCAFDMSRHQDGIDDLRRALDVDPKNEGLLYNLGKWLVRRWDLFGARDLLEKGRKRGMKSAQIDMLLSDVLSQLNEEEEAVRILTALLARQPDQFMVLGKLAILHQTLGEFDVAEGFLRSAMRASPTEGAFYRLYAAQAKDSAVDDEMLAHMKKMFADEGLSDLQRSNFGFALARTMEDAKRFDEVFEYLHPANAMMRAHLNATKNTKATAHPDLIKSLKSLDWQNAPMNEASDAAPIFVTGMPRSGTTLVEQIIASHSTVTGGGELGVAAVRCGQLITNDHDRMLLARDIPLSAFAELAEWYDAYIHRLFPGAGIVTDKSIQTYAVIGLLKRAMPKARFVVVRRDPRDTLLSMYKNVFLEGTHEYAYSLTDLAKRYGQFVELVDLWRELTPDWFYEIQYEDLIANPEEESRKLIDACSLEWEDACLDFHKDDRRVKTLSLHQVRQPIYRSSEKAWMRHRDELKELFDALGPEYADAAE